ncbi:VRR-NUC domain-containing protein [Paraburkholderia phenazinium]|uniref:VRR-NUC domain-containing protein n=1 Tax=Paraburkholderia phenazinium TaxID=60549 RepID=A0A1G7Y5M5_9BURK|nr:VRR-NUC domain-containing protein [Paraburkholderia phenazinium]SDG91762.1 VRR-NUC domain-containing protein [Paraburkholderia phenazinium]
MSGYTGSSATGGTAGGDGQTTQVGLNRRLSPQDQQVLCDAMCKCNRMGVATADGKIRKQSCVAQRLNAANAVSTATTGSPTKYRPEVAYDMRPAPPDPPVPIMSSTSPLEPHSFIGAWIQKYWPGGNDAYQDVKGQGYIRRPDVVIVNDPSQPPVQSNIATVVEMKYPPDTLSRGQQADYIRIAGGSKKFVTMTPADCGCGDDETSEQPSTATQSQSAKDIFGDNLSSGSGNGLPPMLPPVPPVPAFP